MWDIINFVSHVPNAPAHFIRDRLWQILRWQSVFRTQSAKYLSHNNLLVYQNGSSSMNKNNIILSPLVLPVSAHYVICDEMFVTDYFVLRRIDNHLPEVTCGYRNT